MAKLRQLLYIYFSDDKDDYFKSSYLKPKLRKI